MVKYRDVVDIIEESSDSDREADEIYEEPYGPGSELGELRDIPNDDSATEYGCLEEQHWHQQENTGFTAPRNRPTSPSPSTISHYSRSSGWSYSSSSSTSSTSSLAAAGRYISGNMKNFFMKIFSFGSRSAISNERSESPGFNASHSSLDRACSPTSSQRFTVMPSRPTSPTNMSSQRFPVYPSRPGSPTNYSSNRPNTSLSNEKLNLDRSSSPRNLPPRLNISRSRSPTRSESPTNFSSQRFDPGRSQSPSQTQRSNESDSPNSQSSQKFSLLGSRSASPTNLSQRMAVDDSRSGSPTNMSFRDKVGVMQGQSFKDKDALRGGSVRGFFTKAPSEKKLDRKVHAKYCNSNVHKGAHVNHDSFKDLDMDTNGRITFEEFRKSVFASGLSSVDARRAFDKIDADKSGSIDAEEWKAWTKFKEERLKRKKLVTNEMIVEEY